MPRAENYKVEDSVISDIDVRIVTYKIGEQFYCHIENRNPGATIARSTGSNPELAKNKAVANATEKLKR